MDKQKQNKSTIDFEYLTEGENLVSSLKIAIQKKFNLNCIIQDMTLFDSKGVILKEDYDVILIKNEETLFVDLNKCKLLYLKND